jgi:hypothetical protein
LQDNFQSVYNTSPVSYHSSLLSNDFLQLPAVCELDILKAIKRLRLSKSVRLYGIPSFIMNDSSTQFAPKLKHISILACSGITFQRSGRRGDAFIEQNVTALPLVIKDRFI